jgi:AP-2 complex subunit mu-1
MDRGVHLYVGSSPNFLHARQLGKVAKACTMLSGILIFNQKGENLIFRAFRSDCRPRLADIFRIQVISNPQLRSPTLTLGSTTFSHVKHENIYLVAVTKSNANAALVFEFLYRLIALGKGYFGKLDEEAVKNNFVLVYELLDGELWRLRALASC